MSNTDVTKVRVTAASKLMKYDVGINPEVGEPFETLVRVEELVGQDAVDYLKNLGPEGQKHLELLGLGDDTDGVN